MKSVTTDFSAALASYKQIIDEQLAFHIHLLKKQTAQKYTPESRVVVDAYCDIVNRGGKRIRGALTLVGYAMCGGTISRQILDAACAIELTHAYILVLDDIMDRSAKRRGGKAAHAILADYHTKHELAGESYHFGEATAINGALIGCHYAQKIVTKLDLDPAGKIAALQLLNEALVVTGHGQINDIFNEVKENVDMHAVDSVLEWKTAHYTFLNPLQFGMALAGGTQKQISSIVDYCMFAGRAFQITDDILGTFASEQEAGKSPMDDIREGKRTVLSVTALEKAESADKNFILTMLGNEKLTQAEFLRCKEIFVSSGALEEAKKQAADYVRKAVQSLDATLFPGGAEGVDFLQELARQLLGRNR